MLCLKYSNINSLSLNLLNNQASSNLSKTKSNWRSTSAYSRI